MRVSERASERAAGAADSLCPRKLCNSPRLHVFPTPRLPPAVAAVLLPLLLRSLPPTVLRTPSGTLRRLCLPSGPTRSLARCFSSPSVLPLARRSAESVPSRASTTPQLPPSLCHSIAAESSQPDAGTARGRNDPRARQGRAEGVIRSSPYVHRAAPGIRIIKLRDSLSPYRSPRFVS